MLTKRGTNDRNQFELTFDRPRVVPTEINHYLAPPVGKDGTRLMGAGGFSTVSKRTDPHTNQTFAVKHLSIPMNERCFFREVESLVKLNHPCVVRILRWSPPSGSVEAEIHMELAERGSLKDVLDKIPNPTRIGIIICGIVMGMRFVHSQGIIHRDLKPSNILLNAKWHALIADFGASRWISDDWTQDEGETVYYAAPELCEEDVICTTKCDVFSFGLILYEVFARQPVFDPSHGAWSAIKRLRARDFPKIPHKCGALMTQLILQCWRQNTDDRPSFEDIFRSFQEADFKIVPGADSEQIRRFCKAVLDWEDQLPADSEILDDVDRRE
jgi:mitogen-activated protein kinase kinase kinase 9